MEFALIDAFVAAFPRARVPVGPGDDCAVLEPGKGELCVTTDQVVEGVHFLLPGFSMEEVGYKALAVNLSDLAAMGAAPRWFVCAVACPRPARLADIRALARGMAHLARAHRIALVGGNFTSARQLSVTITAAGEVPKGRALLRSGAAPGDLLYVSSRLGDARLGLDLLDRRSLASRLAARAEGRLLAAFRAALRRQKRPDPRVELGLIAGRFASAAVDVSDGLAQDLGHLCARSRVGAELELELLPASPALRALARRRPQALSYTLFGGEDYELVLAVPPSRRAAFERACAGLKERPRRIGVVVRGRGVVGRLEGKAFPLRGGFDHFA